MRSPDTAATVAQSQALCLKSVALCATALALTDGRGQNLCTGATFRYFAERLAQAQARLCSKKGR